LLQKAETKLHKTVDVRFEHMDAVFLVHYNLYYIFVVRVLSDLRVVFVSDF